MCAHVLVVEADALQAGLLHRLLLQEGHTAVVTRNGRAAIDAARSRRPDLIVLELTLPDIDGLRVCRALRRDDDVPVLMLTARSTEEDILLGLDHGADDYVIKPYSPRELMARIRSVLRRAPRAAGGSALLRAGGITVDPVRHLVTCDDAPVSCTPGEFAILQAMAAEPDRVFTRRQLLLHTGGGDRISTERAIDVHIMNLRRKIEPDPRTPVRLLTVFGTGYRLTGHRHAG
ncbi:response regulator transcription factor [Streptomyces sp. CB01881]|uniref:response regulator transcription factor n=1 Tax=Streptomyces sp. CB01881 TaxID=2078691 RepID=UPI000CDBAECE|nr:response regulator transcription factor [Streptomyces sp. CB01881]AUY52614.1 DNA-binding response regulator [Streptomyces sp. CB01881]TYC70333.1 DNA-binding response regulator [Streptomyces sp. CB01881]